MKKQIVISVILIILVIIWWQPINFGKVEITIPKGTSARDIVTYLSDNKIVRDANEFLLWLKISGQEKHLKSGRYELYTYKNPLYVIRNLTRGGISDIIVTIPEGLTIYETADILAAHELITQNQFIQLCTDKTFIETLGLHTPSLEGYLFPDTYSFSSNQTDSAIIRTLITNFNNHIKKFKLNKQDSLEKIIILASLVEKEAKFADERPIIAQVFIKRLQLHRPLESCATVLYALKYENADTYQTTHMHKIKLTEQDLRINSAYNTYVHTGLPPGAICSPGENSIEAVLSPANVEYLYFVSKGDGRHHFSKTYKEHLIAKEHYSAKY